MTSAVGSPRPPIAFVRAAAAALLSLAVLSLIPGQPAGPTLSAA